MCRNCAATAAGSAAEEDKCSNMGLRMRDHRQIAMGLSSIAGGYSDPTYLENPQADFLKIPLQPPVKITNTPEDVKSFQESCVFIAFLVENDSNRAKPNRIVVKALNDMP